MVPDRSNRVNEMRQLRAKHRRAGNILVLLAILLPVLLGIVGLVIDGGLMMNDYRRQQHVTDAAATAAAMDLQLGKDSSTAMETATKIVQVANQMTTANVIVNIPPTEGIFAGRADHVEILVECEFRTRLIPFVGGLLSNTLRTRSVACFDDATTEAAMVILDPDPADLTIAPILTVPALPSLTAGLEVEGLGQFSVDGAILVNNSWGGVDENGDTVLLDLRHGVACTPVVPTTQLRARDIRVVGGVDKQSNYANFVSGAANPLHANRLPVRDPYEKLPVPTTSSSPTDVDPTYRGGVTVAGLPLLGPPVTLRPGVYDYIRVVSGVANFQPGIYIIRGKDPVTHLSLSMLAGSVNAEGVLFYITDSATYDGVSGFPDANDGESPPANSGISSLLPSVVIQAGLLGSGISGLDRSGSPFDGMVIYQRRQDRRPIVLVHQNLIGNGNFSGAVYAKWGHVTFVCNGTYDASFVCGTMRVVTLFNSTLAPSTKFPPATDVFLVE